MTAQPRRVLVDPTGEQEVPGWQRSERPSSLEGRTVGVLDISKARGDVFCDRVAERLRAHGCTVQRFAKPTFTKPAPADLRYEITRQCDVVIEALAD